MLTTKAGNSRHKSGYSPFHITGATSIKNSIFNQGSKRVKRPLGKRSWRDDVNMSRKTERRAFATTLCVEVRDVWRVCILKFKVCTFEIERLQRTLQGSQRPRIIRRNRWAPNQGLRQRQRITQIRVRYPIPGLRREHAQARHGANR